MTSQDTPRIDAYAARDVGASLAPYDFEADALGPHDVEIAITHCGSCLQCEWCERGDENLCSKIVETCVGRPGGFADRIRVDGRFAFSIPDALSSEVAAPLLCGGSQRRRS